jgi:hypothetical protein
MPSWGVDYGGQANLFNVGQSAGQSLGSLFSGATELKRATAEANINRLNARTRLDDQEYDARNGLGQANYDSWVKAHPQGASNANPSGASPVVVEDPNAQRARYGGVLATSANDAATAYNTQTGGYLVQNGGPNEMRRGAALMGHLPTNNTVLGPDDTVGTDATIRIDQAKEQAKAEAEQSTLSPYQKGPFGKTGIDDNMIFSINQKLQRGEKLTPEEENLRVILENNKKVNETTTVENPDKTKTLVTHPGANNPFISAPTPTQPNQPAIVQPTPSPGPGPAPSVADPRAPAPVVVAPNSPTSAPAPNMPSPAAPKAPANNSLTIGTPQPITPTEGVVKLNMIADQAIDAEKYLTKITPDQVGDFFAAVASMNPDAKYTSQQFMQQFSTPQQREFARNAMMFVEPILRLKSGAALSSSEWAGAFMQFVPPPAATQRDIDSTRLNRMTVLRSLISSIYGQQPEKLNQINQILQTNGIDLNYSPPAATPTSSRKKPTIKGVTEIFN